jgi:uncharacterized protein involved in exopolysaccharide biosynthesis
MQSPETSMPPDNEIDLLDLLVVLAENLRLLIAGTVLAGLVGLVIAFSLPKTYESTSILSPSKNGLNVSGQVIASYIQSADILEQVAKDLQFEQDASSAQRLKKLGALIQVSVGKQEAPLVTLTTQGPSPEKAQALNATIWKKLLPHTAPRGKEQERLQQQLEAESARLASAETLEAAALKQLQSGASSEGLSRLYGELQAANSKRQELISKLESQMEGLTEENLAQQPTLTELPAKPQKSLIVLGCSAAGGMLLLLFVLIRHALHGANQNPAQAGKVARLRAALGLKP